MAKLLTPERQATIRDSWETVMADSKGNGMSLFVMLFTDHPEFKALFPNFRARRIEVLRTSIKLQGHANRVMAKMTEIVDNLDNIDRVVLITREVVHDHAKRSVRLIHYENLLAAAVRVVQQALGDAWTKETEEAWGAVVTILLAVIKTKLENLAQSP